MLRTVPTSFAYPSFVVGVLLWVLSGCATSHEPVAYQPYFSVRQSAYTGPELLSELNEAEKKELAMPYEKKRLYDLYQAELSYLKPNSPRYATLAAAAAKLKPELEAWEIQRAAIEKETKEISAKTEVKPTVGPRPLAGSEWRKQYSEIMQLWNKEQTDVALQKLDALEKGPLTAATPADRNKFLQVGFRIALEQGDLNRAGRLYNSMNQNEHCGYEAALSGFLYSLVLFGENRAEEAKNIFDSLCEIDDSAAEKIRRDYWRARFLSKSNPEESKRLLERIARLPLPGYHTFMALYHLGRVYEMPKTGPEIAPRPYLSETISVPGAVHEDWLAAEERLRYNLRRDAQVFLARASARLRQNPDEGKVPAMLYTAHLFHAAGNHLESMRLYTEVASVLADNYDADASLITPTVIADMFPRVVVGKVEWLSNLWDMDADFVYAIARQESAFNPTAVSVTDARGWMQLMPPLAKSIAKSWGLDGKFNDRHLFHVDENLKFGVFHLRQLRDLLGHPVLIAGAYNAGASRSLNWQKRYGHYPLDIFVELVPINETRNYMKLVLRNFFVYKALHHGSVDPKVVSFQVGPKAGLP